MTRNETLSAAARIGIQYETIRTIVCSMLTSGASPTNAVPRAIEAANLMEEWWKMRVAELRLRQDNESGEMGDVQ